MKKLVCCVLSAILVLCLYTSAFAADTNVNGVTAKGYVVVDAQTGQVLLEKNARQMYYPASITKIMTMALALEKSGGNLDIPIVVSSAATKIPQGSSHVALLEGEQITLRDAMMATLLHSANDGANVLAEYTAGSIDEFVKLMNARAVQIGCEGTSFSNAHGFHDAQHYVTASDMAKITYWAYTVQGFEELFQQSKYTMPANNKQPERTFASDNLMIVEGKYKYEGTLGGKSGYTTEAGYTMVEVAQRDGRRLISVVLGCEAKFDRYTDSIALMDYGFSNFRPVTLDGAAFASKTAQVFGGGDKPLGEVKINVPSVMVQLPAGVSQNDLQVEYNIPEKYIIGQPFAAFCSIYLKAQGSDNSSPIAVVQMEIGSLGEILARNTGAFAVGGELVGNERGVNIWLIILGFVLFCALALIAGRIACVAFFKAQRRRRKLEIMRTMYYETSVGPSISAQQARERTVQQRNAYSSQRAQQYAAPQKGRQANTQQNGLRVIIGGSNDKRRASK